jgi:hypothetical protein
VFRTDDCGAWMARSAYGDTDAAMGWQVDHILPKSKGGDDELPNLRPLHWRNNARKGDAHPWDVSQGVEIPPPPLAVLLKACGANGALPNRVTAADDVDAFIVERFPPATEMGRFRQAEWLRWAREHATVGHAGAATVALGNAIQEHGR